jgi:hypothetical protein
MPETTAPTWLDRLRLDAAHGRLVTAQADYDAAWRALTLARADVARLLKDARRRKRLAATPRAAP